LGLCVQSSVMSALLEIRIDNDQFMISGRAEPACNHPFDSIQRADSHSTHVASTISLWGLDVVEFPQCVWTVTFLNLEQIQNGTFIMNIISELMQQPWRSSRRAFAGPICLFAQCHGGGCSISIAASRSVQLCDCRWCEAQSRGSNAFNMRSAGPAETGWARPPPPPCVATLARVGKGHAVNE